MSRRFDDQVEVRVSDGSPTQFLWRGRLYLVREVLCQWRGTGQWWRGPEIRGLMHGLTTREAVPSESPTVATVPAPRQPLGRPEWPLREPSAGRGADGAGAVGIDLQEREFWRVVAGAGRSAGVGVYDLCFEESRGYWTLARTHD